MKVSPAPVEALLESVGITHKDVYRIEVTPDHVVVSRYLRNDEGKRYVHGGRVPAQESLVFHLDPTGWKPLDADKS